jgi:alanine racemase
MHDHLIWAEIDTSAIAQNIRELRRITDPRARLLAAVKADGYGHGAVRVAQIALQNGATDLGVARIEEGVALRQAGIAAPILIFGPTSVVMADALFDHGLTPTVFSLENTRGLAKAALARRTRLAVHIKVDTGMGRLGIPCDALRMEGDAAAEIMAIADVDGIRVEGLFTHFASSDEADKSDARTQFSRFQELLNRLESQGLHIPQRHAANSGAIIDLPEAHLEMVRAGISVYGLYPSPHVSRERIGLRPAMSLKARIIHLKRVPAGTPISYGGTYRTASDTTIATISAGYGDGFDRGLSNCGCALVSGRRVPIVGRVCMDLTMLDVGKLKDLRLGDEAVLMGSQGKATISADELARMLGTINYEVVTRMMGRVPRVYV